MNDSVATLTLNDENPWPGLDSYKEVAHRYFHGREEDSAELLRLIRLSPFVALYGKSGLGKTSLLQAGVFPQLRVARFLPVYLRLDYAEGAEQPPLAQALARLQQEIDATGADAIPPEPGEALWAYLQRRERPIWTQDNFPVTPVLVFDQFEEVFSRGGSPAHIKAVLDAIADLVGDRLTSEVAEDHDAVRRLNLQSQQYRIVLAFRSDFLAEVETWERLANLPKHEALHLKALTRETAIDAVQRAGAAVLEPGVAAKIVDFVLARDDSGEQGLAAEVEPVLLSLCCYQLNSRRSLLGKIDGALLASVGKDILHNFYSEALQGTAPRVSVFIEDNLILGGRYRSSFPREEAIACGALTDQDLARLMSRRLLRVDPQGDVLRIELIHDRLVGIVREAKEARLQRERDHRQKLGLDSETMQRLELLGYQVEERIGEGGIGVVYRAVRVADARKIALKILRKLPADGSPLEGGGREFHAHWIEAARQLNHQGIVSVLNVHDEVGAVILAMPWVDGLAITQALQGAAWDAKADALASVCDAVACAHRSGIVHGNLKPNNLLVGTDGSLKVLDLGVHVRGANADESVRRNEPAAAVSALFLAPEQVRGEAKVGPAADVYAIGVVMYELLTGLPPFAADSSHRILDAHLHDAPELPMLKRDDVPEPLQRICLKALEKSEEDRYRSASDMQEDLERYRQGKPLPTRPSYYNNLIESPARGHVAAIDRWHDQALITDDEHVRLRRAYQSLTRSGLQAIRESRLVHWWVLALYLGGWIVLDGAAWWLALYYHQDAKQQGLSPWDEQSLWFAAYPMGRVLLSLIPAVVANGLWHFFDRRGSYRFAFAAMIVGLLSLPFAVGVSIHEIVDEAVNWTAGGPVDCKLGAQRLIDHLKCPVVWGDPQDQIFNGEKFELPNIQLFIALLAAVIWSAYVALESRTFTSATITGLYFVALYLIGLDFWGLNYLFKQKLSYGGACMLPVAAALIIAGVYTAQKLEQPRQAVPLFAIAMVVIILASQAIAIAGPKDREWNWPTVKIGAIEVALGLAYFACSRFLRNRFRVEAVSAYRVFAWLAPAAFLVGLALMDFGWANNEMNGEKLPQWSGFLGKELTPWTLVLLASSIVVVFLAARLQSYFCIICGLLFLDYSSWRITFASTQGFPAWPWPFMILSTGLAVIAWLAWRDYRLRSGEDIDDVGERLVRRFRLREAGDRGGARGVSGPTG